MPSRRGRSYWRLSIDASVVRPVGTDRAARRAAALFGLDCPAVETLYKGFRLDLRAGEITAVIGPSGAGKSVLLRQVARQVRPAVRLRLAELAGSRASAAALLRSGGEAERLEMLSRCGLAEASVLAAPACRLSAGQLYRLALAEALHRAGRAASAPRRRGRRPVVVLADEFASALDAATAEGLCRQVRGLITGSPLALLAATPRAELLDALRPDQVIVKPLGEPARLERRPGDCRPLCPHAAGPPSCWPIEPGRIGDYRALERFHYLSDPPALHKRVYVVRTPPGTVEAGGPAIAAVLVVSPPVSRCRGRNAATGGRYATGDRRADLRRLNAEVETISRVVVHPVYRGFGLAVRLIRHALMEARTPLVEALAAMGAVHPLFEKAGMTCAGRFRGRKEYFYYLWIDWGKAGAFAAGKCFPPRLPRRGLGASISLCPT